MITFILYFFDLFLEFIYFDVISIILLHLHLHLSDTFVQSDLH